MGVRDGRFWGGDWWRQKAGVMRVARRPSERPRMGARDESQGRRLRLCWGNELRLLVCGAGGLSNKEKAKKKVLPVAARLKQISNRRYNMRNGRSVKGGTRKKR